MVSELPLPPPELRWGGPRYADDEEYIRSGTGNARMLERECGVTAFSRVLDIGCGQARLMNGLLAHFGSIRRYVGIDVHKPSIDWLKRNVEPVVSFAAFHHVPFANRRYNPGGGDRLDLRLNETFDTICLFSVFSHMELDHIGLYLPLMSRVLARDGKIFLTAFVEDGVEPEVENPLYYHREWTGALHCVRLNRQTFEELAWKHGLQVSMFRHRHTNDGQSSYVLTGAGRAFAAKVVA